MIEIDCYHTDRGVEQLTIHARMQDNARMWISIFGLEWIETINGEVIIFPSRPPGWRFQMTHEEKENETMTTTPTQGKKSNRGFASMSTEERKRIASLGGNAAQRTGKAHRFTSEEAQAAGRKGGSISRRTKSKAQQ